MNHTPIRIVVRSVDHDGKSLLSTVVDEVDEAFVAYGQATQGGDLPAGGSLLDELRRSKELTRYIEHQMAMVARSYSISQTPRNVLEIIRAGVLEPSQMLHRLALQLGAALNQLPGIGRDFDSGAMARATDGLQAFVAKIVQIGDKIIQSRTESIRLETEFCKALEDVRKKHLGVDCDRRGKFKSSITANRGAVYLLFRELISNSFKYRDTGRILLLSTHDRCDTATLDFYYSDNGIGIPPSDCERKIFEPGVRLDSAIALGEIDPKSSGRGLGLSIVKSIITSMGGQIEATSTLGNGAQFSIRLPRLPNGR